MKTLSSIYQQLSLDLSRLTFSDPVTHVYNPLEYAWSAHKQYLDRFGQAPKKAVFLGMNPGPFGMAQTGVPFGAVSMVRDWMNIEAEIGKPPIEHPKRHVVGFEITKEEVSGTRFWGWAKSYFGLAENFFDLFFVANHCPLVFMEASGKNRTPDKLPANERQILFDLCDNALSEVVDVLKPDWVIGIGKFAEARAKKILGAADIKIASILHPSPASPVANRGWAPQAEAQLIEIGLL